MSTPTEITIVQSQGPDGRYTKVRISQGKTQLVIDLTHEQLGRALGGITVVVEAPAIEIHDALD